VIVSTPATLVLRALRPRAGRAALSAAGVGSAALLVLVLLAARRSLETGVTAVAGARGVDLWVAPQGTDNLVRASGGLPRGTLDAVRSVAGVERADPVCRAFVPVEAGSGKGPRRLTLLALGVAGADGFAGPSRMVSGRVPSGPVEIALDRAAAHRLGVGLGDPVVVGGHPAVVVGLTRDTNLLATQFLFFDLSASDALHPVSFVAVRLAGGADRDDAARRIGSALSGVAVLTRDEFVQGSVREATSGIRPLFVLVSALGLVVAAVLVALLLQGLVEDRRADVAVLLAMGSRSALLAGGLVVHAAALAGAGSMAGALVAPLLAGALDRFAPTVELATSRRDALAVLALFIAAGAAGGLAPLARLLRVEPVEAFRA